MRANVLDNAEQKAMEIFDCEAISDAPLRLDATKRNLVEQNIFSVSHGSWNTHDRNAIQHGGQFTIVRRNVFLKDLGGGVAYQSYASESLFVYGNRLYHNTFYDNRCFGLIGFAGDPKQYRDNRAVNNLFYKNSRLRGTRRPDVHRRPAVRHRHRQRPRNSGSGFCRRSEARPEPQERQPHDRSRRAADPHRSAGDGTTMPVGDVYWFSEGLTIPGEAGDEIQLLGTTESARIVSIDFTARTLTLDRALTWQSGQGVALKFSGQRA